MAIQLIHDTEQGFAVIGLRTATTELRMVPELGGRVISLRTLGTGREWCWHQDRPDWLWANPENDNFGNSTQAGIDECIPTVSSSRFKGRDLPDHGEVWFRKWELDPEALGRHELKARLELAISPFIFTRTIRADEDGTFHFDYALENTGSDVEPFIWCFHPLFNILPGDRIALPTEVQGLKLDGGIGAPIERGDTWAYPEPFPGIRLDELAVPGMPGGCVKGFTDALSEGRAALVNEARHEKLELRWDATEVPYLGLWLNRGFVDFHHVALEPTTGTPDSLQLAVEDWKRCLSIAPGATKTWSLELRF